VRLRAPRQGRRVHREVPLGATAAGRPADDVATGAVEAESGTNIKADNFFASLGSTILDYKTWRERQKI
jgi:hypothetical protein